MTVNPPINACFLYCSKNISYEEIKYFLLRCFLCDYYVLFCMINMELLNYQLRRNFIILLKKYIRKYKKFMKSCLLLIINSKDEELHKIISKQKIFKDSLIILNISKNSSLMKDASAR